MLIARKILFYVFVILYLCACPLILLYAFGYIFKPVERGLVKTGLISIATVPSEAAIYIENRRYTKKTPAVIRDLIPGNYALKLILRNHQPWARSVSIHAGKAEVLDRIILLPNALNPVSFSSENYEELIPLSGTHYFIVAKGSNLEDYFVYDWQKSQMWPLLKPDGPPLQNFKVLSYFTVKGSPYLFLQAASKTEEKFLWVELKTRANQITDITRFISERPMSVKWDPQDPHILFIFKNNRLHKLDLNAEVFYPDFALDIRGYGIYDKMVYILTSVNLFLKVDYEGKKQELLHDDARAETPIFGKKGYFDIEPVSKSIILFYGENGKLFANLLPYKFVEKSVVGWAGSVFAERIAFWQKEKLGLLDFSKEKTEGDIFGKAPAFKWVFSNGGNIRQAFWVYKDSHVLFLDYAKVYLLEVRGNAIYGPRYLFEVKSKSGVFYSEESGKLYFLDASSGNLSFVEIIPEKEMFAFPFTEAAKKQEEARKQ